MKKMICIGDSLTYGLGVPVGDSWVELLNRESSCDVINKGINGDTSGGMLARLNRDVLEHQPDLVFLMGGANDFIMGCGLGVVRANLMAMVHQMYHARIPVILGIEIAGDSAHVRPDWQQLADFCQVNEKIRAMAEWLPGFCGAFQIPYVDLYREFGDAVRGREAEFFIDGVHPNVRGHRLIADSILKKMEQLV